MIPFYDNLDPIIPCSRLNLQCVMFDVLESELKLKLSSLFKKAQKSAGIN